MDPGGGYVPWKSWIGPEVMHACVVYAGGEVYLHPAIASNLVDGYFGTQKGKPGEDPYERLTDREKQVLKLIAEGYAHKEITNTLNISVKTVITHQANLCEKPDIPSRASILKFTIQKGIIKIDA
jgi:two-component system response regulator NreC